MTNHNTLDISVVIATRDRAASLGHTLESMAAMETQGLTWEIVVIDNGSRDRTIEVLRSYMHRLPLSWLTVAEPGQNRARNTVLPSLRGKLTILTDDDVVVARDWLRQWREGVARWPQDAIFGGTITPRFPAGTPQWIASPDFPFRGQCFAAFAPQSEEGYCDRTPFGPNFAIRTDLLKRHPFREDLGPTEGAYAVGGETELTERLRSAGHRVVYLPGPWVEHVLMAKNLSLEKLQQRARNSGRGDEYRRAMRKKLGRATMVVRRRVLLPAKLAFYSLCAPLALSQRQRFRLAYKACSTRGRIDQLSLMLDPGSRPSAVASPSLAVTH
jgi:glycosyltransferase involved in cell wall biosynthesis